MSRAFVYAAMILMVAGAPAVRAHEALRPRVPSELLIGTGRDLGYRVLTARVVAFNRPALVERWPELARMDDDAVKRWILDRCAYVNSRQLTLTGIRNTLIDFDLDDRKTFWIQPGVGRGADLEVDGQMINLKGTGNTSWNEGLVEEMVDLAERSYVRRARRIDHGSGLETFYIAAAEYLRHFTLQAEFDRLAATGRAEIEAVDALFLLDYGFDIMAPDENLRAFVIGRDAHFGRVADDARFGPELYEDYGLHQATYSGARIDFGGARTAREVKRTFAERAKTLGPDRMVKYVQRELAKIAAEDTPARVRVPPRVRTSVFRGTPYRRRRVIDPRVLGRGDLVTPPEYVGDARGLARFKWSLMRMTSPLLARRLKTLSDADLRELFAQSTAVLRMPLPEAAYLHGFDRAPEVREMALAAARRVFDRFPNLRERFIAEVLEDLEDPADRPPPIHINELFTWTDNFEGLSEIVLAASFSRNVQIARLARARALELIAHAKSRLESGEAEIKAEHIATCENWLNSLED